MMSAGKNTSSTQPLLRVTFEDCCPPPTGHIVNTETGEATPVRSTGGTYWIRYTDGTEERGSLLPKGPFHLDLAACIETIS